MEILKMYGGGQKFLSGGGAGIPFPHTPFPSRPAGAKHLGIFQKMVSSRTVKIHQNLTFCKFPDHFGGRAKRVPSISPRQILSARRGEPRLAVGQDEVRLPHDFNSVSDLLCPKLLTNKI